MKPLLGAARWLGDLLFSRRFLWLMCGINAVGAASGYLWYAGQLAVTRWYYWPFVPDSPLAATLFSAMLAAFLARRRGPGWQLLALLASVWIIKYGFWAMGILTDYRAVSSSGFSLLEWALWLSHLGMALEGLLYLPFLGAAKWQALIVTLWLGWNDYVDYGLGQHPYLFFQQQHALARSLAFSLTAVLAAFVWLKSFSSKNNPS
ncbi:MAG: DUF1405 domain-containing protein [Clostridia bacterium]|nr:DUF1405 domain-containing protein [Clostridia bacterium]